MARTYLEKKKRDIHHSYKMNIPVFGLSPFSAERKWHRYIRPDGTADKKVVSSATLELQQGRVHRSSAGVGSPGKGRPVRGPRLLFLTRNAPPDRETTAGHDPSPSAAPSSATALRCHCRRPIVNSKRRSQQAVKHRQRSRASGLWFSGWPLQAGVQAVVVGFGCAE
jgi:hypothetical protein